MSAIAPFDETQRFRNTFRKILGRYVDHLLQVDGSLHDSSLSAAPQSDTILSLLSRCQALDDRDNYIRLLSRFAGFLERTIPLRQLDEHLAVALSFDTLSPDHCITLASTRLRLLTQLGEIETATAVLDSSWAIANGFPYLLAELCIRQGVLAVSIGDSEGGKQAYERGLIVAEAYGDPARMSILFNNLGNLAYSIDQYQDALNYFRKALELATQVEDPIHRTRAEGGLALTLDELSRFDEAELHYQEAKKAADQAGDLFSVLSIELNLCYHALLQQEFELAKTRAVRALNLARQLGDWDREAHALHNLGQACLGAADYEAAWAHLSQALEMRLFIGKGLYIRTTRDMIAELARAVEDDPYIEASLRVVLLQNCHNALEAAHDVQPPVQEMPTTELSRC